MPAAPFPAREADVHGKSPKTPARNRRIPFRATYRLQFHKDSASTPPPRCPLSGPARRQPCLCLALPEGAAGQHPWLRHRRPQRAQSRARRRRRLRARWSRRCASTGWARSSTSCRTTWASAAPTTRCGWTCSNGGRIRPTPAGSTSIGIPTAATCTGKLLVPFLGDQYGAVLEAGELVAEVRRGGRQLRGLGLRHPQAADLPAALRRDPGRRASGAGAARRRLRRPPEWRPHVERRRARS